MHPPSSQRNWKPGRPTSACKTFGESQRIRTTMQIAALMKAKRSFDHLSKNAGQMAMQEPLGGGGGSAPSVVPDTPSVGFKKSIKMRQ